MNPLYTTWMAPNSRKAILTGYVTDNKAKVLINKRDNKSVFSLLVYINWPENAFIIKNKRAVNEPELV